jgi:hypothetical protein
MRSALLGSYKSKRKIGFVGLSSALALGIYLSGGLYAQATGTGSKSPPKATNPRPPPILPNFKLGGHDGQAPPPAVGGMKRNEFVKPPAKRWWENLDWTLSTLYQFSSQRSRIGDGTFDSNSAIIDLSVRYNARPYTSADVSYSYSHVSGSVPTGPNVTTDQYAGFLRVLQPLNPAWCPNWKPADLETEKKLNHQLAILAGVGYGGSPGSLTLPNSPVVYNTSHTVFGDALLDYQFAWFPCRPAEAPDPRRLYPSLLFELSSGVQGATVCANSSSAGVTTTSSARQVDYLNIASLTYSFPCRFGFQVAIAWDSPLDSQPLRGAKPDRANTATFSGGLVYNTYPSKPGKPKSGEKSIDASCNRDKTVTWWDCLRDSNRWSGSVLYSYTAFDPLTETNTLQVQISYSF